MYRKREKRGQKAGFPFPFTLRKKTNKQTSKQNKTEQIKDAGASKTGTRGREPGLKGTRRGRFNPLSPHPRKKRMVIDSKVES